MKPGKAWLVPALAVLGWCGCATPTPPGISPDANILGFLKNGATRRAEVVERLGEPSAVFEQDHILTYRVAGDSKRGFWIRGRVGQPNFGWIGVNNSLVLVFDESGVLQRHSLVAVQ
jgi:hypothetical protein